MAVGMTFEVEGLEEVLKALRQAEDKEVRQAVFDEGKKITKTIRDDAKMACPVDTGNLKSAIRSSNSKKKLVFSVYVSDKVAYYAPFVEYGHRTKDGKAVPEQPFLIPAGRKHEKEFQEAMEKALLKVASEVVK